HWDIEGYHLKDRYPQILEQKENYFLFTFVRDPLDLKISLYFYELKVRKKLPYTLEERLFSSPNYLARRFPCTADNYKDVLNRYDVVWIMEQYEESVRRLAAILGKKELALPHVNKSERTTDVNGLSHDIVEKFKHHIQLDYVLYRFCRQRFDQTLS